MTIALVLPLMTLLAAADEGPGWKEAAKTDGITVYSRQKPGSDVSEMKATGLLEAPPQAVWKALRDYNNYKKTMPYTEESRIVSEKEGGKLLHFYSVVAAPLVSRRDYVIEVKDESEWKEGQGFLKVTWKAVDGVVPPREGVVRVAVNEGFWRLEPREGGAKTYATYYVYTNPGGGLPNWVVNMANSNAVPDVFRAVRREAAKAQGKK
jgi:hypothetical protein